ncbi:MAG: hypothetical protein V2A65_05035 [Candidatus Omnitrophota bacterium]
MKLKKGSFWIIPLAFFSLVSGASAGMIITRPGNVNHFTLKIPPEIRAGESFKMEVEARDTNENLVTNYFEREREVSIEVLGTGKFEPTIVRSTDFREGAAVIECRYTRAEPIEISVHEERSSASGAIKTVVLPGKPDRFEAVLPLVTRSGQPFRAKITAIDENGNTITNYGSEGNRTIRISTDSFGIVNPDKVEISDFRNGVISINMSCLSKAGPITFFFKDEVKGIMGKQTMAIEAGILDHFEVVTPVEVTAGTAFMVMIKARDFCNNLVTNYNKEGKEVYITATGTGSIGPGSIPASSFKDGVATMTFVYTKTEPFTMMIHETQTGEIVNREITEVLPSSTTSPAPTKPAIKEEGTKEISIPPSEKVNDLLNQVLAAIDSNDYERALKLVNELLEIDPNNEQVIKLRERLREIVRLLTK